MFQAIDFFSLAPILILWITYLTGLWFLGFWYRVCVTFQVCMTPRCPPLSHYKYGLFHKIKLYSLYLRQLGPPANWVWMSFACDAPKCWEKIKMDQQHGNLCSERARARWGRISFCCSATGDGCALGFCWSTVQADFWGKIRMNFLVIVWCRIDISIWLTCSSSFMTGLLWIEFYHISIE